MSDFPVAAPPIALRSALVDAIGRRRRIRSRVAVAGAVCVAVAAAVLAGGVLSDGPERVLAIDDSSEWVTVRILDGDAGAAEMTRELQDAGIDAEVQALPARPDEVGRWLGFNLGAEGARPQCDRQGNAPPDLECANAPLLAGDDVRFGDDAFQIRRDAVDLLSETRSTFYVGREPEPGESPVDPPAGTDLQFLYPGVVQTGSGTSPRPAP